MSTKDTTAPSRYILRTMRPWNRWHHAALDYSGTLSAWSREFFRAAVCTCDLVHVPVVQHHWQDDLTLSSRLRLKKFPRSAGRCSTDAFSGSPNGRTLVTTAKTGCLSSPLVINPGLSAKERSKSTGWASSTVICVRGCGPGVLFSVQNRLYISNRLLFCRQNAGL